MFNLLLQCTFKDAPYLPMLKPILSGYAQTFIHTVSPDTLTETVLVAKSKGCSHVATTSDRLLQLLIGEGAKGTVDDYAGSVLRRQGIEFLILNPLEQLASVTYGKFLFQRYFDKFIDHKKWLEIPEFTWELFEPKNIDRLLTLAAEADLTGYDIETPYGYEPEDERSINCISFSHLKFLAGSDGISGKEGRYKIDTVVIPLVDEFAFAFIRCLLATTVPKVTQNGKFDNSYLLLFGSPAFNWSFDTINLFHCWYSELPKRLDFITSFMLREWEYWKSESNTGDLLTYYRYNAKDSFVTVLNLLALLREMPPYAWTNYLQEFPLVFPCLLSEMTGIKIDQHKKDQLSAAATTIYEGAEKKLRQMVASPYFNPGSYQQTLKLFNILGSEDIKSTDKVGQDRVSARHPLNRRILGDIKKYREKKKLNSSYFAKDLVWKGRCFYALNPHGTDTGRLASKESHWGCGLQIQNIPSRDQEIPAKEMFVADPGFHIGEADYSQNEARGTAYLSGDTALITAVNDETKDFHGRNASSFFGLPYEKIMESTYSEEEKLWIHKTIDKPIRDLSKRTNHGTNYNMTAGVLLDTMGILNVIKARTLLKLPSHWTLVKVCEYLLRKYDETYPVVRSDWYNKCVADVIGTGLLVGPTGWTRKCFGDPKKNKHYLNAYVAHPPQSLGAMALNRAYLAVFHKVWMPNYMNFKLLPQIHDSIVFMYRKGHEDLAWQVKDAMEFDIPIRDTFGIVRNLRVPVDLKGDALRWSDVRPLKRAA